jgi:hypothetical protein
MTKYWIGPVVALHLFATVAVMAFGNFDQRAAFNQYLHLIAPLAVADVLIRFTALRLYRHYATPRTSLFKAVTLVYATWPIYALGWMMAVLRLPLGFRPTPKTRDGGMNPLWLLPQILALVLIAAGILYTVLVLGHPVSILLLFALIQAGFQLLFLARWLYSRESFGLKKERSKLTSRSYEH